MVTDALGTWEDLGEILIDDQWRIFPVTTISEIFRVTTTILYPDDWDKLLKSAGLIRFYYPGNNISRKHYISVQPDSAIIELLIPKQLKDNGIVLRDIGCKMSHRRVGKISLASFGRWKLKIEGLI